MNFEQLDKLASEYGTPYYLMYGKTYIKNIHDFQNAFKKRYEKLIVGYSFKTNYVPALCQIAKDAGCYAEVVSDMEFQIAQKLGFKHIIFNGPIKTEENLAAAIETNAIINVDSEYEIDSICRYKEKHPECNPQIGLRINIRLTDIEGHSTIQCGLRQGRFGFPHDILEWNISKLRTADIDIVSLHGHTSSSDRTVNNYQIITEQMLNTCKLFQLNNLRYFDIGGGFFGAAAEGINTSGKPKYEDYANIILDKVLSDEWFKTCQPSIVIEPGSSVVSNVFEYVTKVYQNKQIEDVHFVTVDGSVFDVKPTLHSNNLPFSVVRKEKREGVGVCDVVGSTCMEKDVILKDVQLPKVEKGDYIIMRGVGAYTISLTPTFINFLSPILCVEEDIIEVIRRRQNIEDVLNIYEVK